MRWKAVFLRDFRQYGFLLAVLIVGIVFSYILFWKTFWISDGFMYIAGKIWSDFSATIPLTRSFSYGNNFPPEYPLFSGPPIRYHFIFYTIVGLLERLGIRLDIALNLLSTFGFVFLLFMIYKLGSEVFEKKSVGVLSVILFLFNGSLGFISYFQKHGGEGITKIFTNTTFSSFGPYDGNIISAFWSLNIFTNQRHLALSYASFLFFLYLLIQLNKVPQKFTFPKIFSLAVFVGIFPFFHMVVFLMMGITLILYFLFAPKIRWEIFLLGILALSFAFPQIMYMGSSQVQVPFFNPGYLAEEGFFQFFRYWVYNLGFLCIALPFAFLKSNKNQRFFFIPFFVLFLIGNMFQFSPEIAANHKFFNMFLIGANMFVAYFMVILWNKRLIGKILIVPLFVLLTLTGFIDLFPIMNDSSIKLADIPQNSTAQFILENTPPNAVFLNSTYLFDPASLAGRKIYLGWPYFAWSAGYDTTARNETMKRILGGEDKTIVCNLLQKEKIDYVSIENPTPFEEIEIDYHFWKKDFKHVHFNESASISIYEVKNSCPYFY